MELVELRVREGEGDVMKHWSNCPAVDGAECTCRKYGMPPSAKPPAELVEQWPPGGKPTEELRECAECGDTIYPGEHVYPPRHPAADSGLVVLCAVCHVKARASRGA